MNLEFYKKIDELASKLRTALGFEVNVGDYNNFVQVDYLILSESIKYAFGVEILDEDINDTYVMRNQIDENREETSANKKRFTIYIDKKYITNNVVRVELLIHELAHILLHENEIPYGTAIGKDTGTWEQEQEANFFVRAFLIPENLFIKALGEYSRNDGTVNLEGFSKKFGVNQQLIVERGHDLRIW